jgi:chaperone protein EcpD
MFRAFRRAATALALAAATLPAFANIVITGTRVIYPEGAREQTVRLANRGDSPVLVQAWIDENGGNKSPQDARSPFLLTPAVFRLDGEKGQALRVKLIDAKLPADRESVYWLNVLEVPVKAKEENFLQMAIRTRLKIFYRPKGLEQASDQVAKRLDWRVVEEGGRRYIECSNPTAFHASLTELKLKGREANPIDADMVAPFSSKRWPLEANDKPATLSFGIVNDYGAVVLQDAQIGA